MKRLMKGALGALILAGAMGASALPALGAAGWTPTQTIEPHPISGYNWPVAINNGVMATFGISDQRSPTLLVYELNPAGQWQEVNEFGFNLEPCEAGVPEYLTINDPSDWIAVTLGAGCDPSGGTLRTYHRGDSGWEFTQKITFTSPLGLGQGLIPGFASNGDLLSAEGDIGLEIRHLDASGQWVLTQLLPDDDPSCLFGYNAIPFTSHSVSGTQAAFPCAAINAGDPDQIWTYALQSDGTWARTAKILLPVSQSGEFLPLAYPAVAIDDGYMAAVSSYFTDSAYIYKLENGVWSQTATLTDYSQYLQLAGDGDRLLLGCGRIDSTTLLYPNPRLYELQLSGVWEKIHTFTPPAGYSQEDDFSCPVVRLSLDGDKIGMAIVDLGVDVDYPDLYTFYTQSDLSLSMQAAGSVVQNANFTATVTATNAATIASPSFTIEVVTPAGASFQSANGTGATCTNSGGTVDCMVDPIAANGGTATVNLEYKATGASGTSFTLTAEVPNNDPALSASDTVSISGGTNPPDDPGGGGGGFGLLALLALLGIAVGASLGGRAIVRGKRR